MKKVCSLLCALALFLGLTACGGSLTALDAADYVQGLLDATYLGLFDEDYLKRVDITEEEARTSYKNGLDVEYAYFTHYFDMNTEYLTEQTRTAIVALLADIYQHANYQVGTAARAEDGFTVEVTVRPIDIIPMVVENDMEDYSAAFAASYADTDQAAVTAMSAIEQDAFWTVYENDWANGVVELFRGRMEELDHLEARTVTARFRPDEDGCYTISHDDLASIDALILAYSR